jgi:hypothetical protein
MGGRPTWQDVCADLEVIDAACQGAPPVRHLELATRCLRERYGGAAGAARLALIVRICRELRAHGDADDPGFLERLLERAVEVTGVPAPALRDDLPEP